MQRTSEVCTYLWKLIVSSFGMKGAQKFIFQTIFGRIIIRKFKEDYKYIGMFNLSI